MLFCITANYTPQALNALMDHPAPNRLGAVQELLGAAGGKVVAMYGTVSDGPGAMLIFDVPDPSVAPSVSGAIAASGAVQNLRMMRLLSQEELPNVRQKGKELRGAYRAAGQ